MGEMRIAYKISVGIPEKKRLLWRSRRRWDGNIKETWCENVEWIQMAQDWSSIGLFGTW
jgi:hypothetical protein